VNKLHQDILKSLLAFLAALGVPAVQTWAQELRLETRTLVGNGWHNWYEVKSDPESPKNLIICGTKLDALRNTFLGVVYASSDGGTTWQAVLEDRNTAWVTEHSCAFGARHRAYFISEASKVIDGKTYHDLGTTRLYVSTDGGQHWTETIKTAWADYSTSVVSSTSARLYTFFNSGPTTSEPGKNWGSNVGLLIFSPDGKKVAGPFFNSAIQNLDYHGAYPSHAIALKSGAVVALYHGPAGPPWREADLGIIRADQSLEPSLESTIISHLVLGADCRYTDKGSLAYDPERNRLFALYGDGCKGRSIMFTSSDDEGRTWAKSVALADPQNPNRTIYSPSLVAGSGGVLGLLWRDGEIAGKWFFSYIRDQKLIEPPTELSNDPEYDRVSNDSLWTWITHPGERHGEAKVSEPLITLNVHTALNNVMNVLRVSGVIAAGDKFLAVWPSGNSNGMQLYSGVLSSMGSASTGAASADAEHASYSDVTQQTVILYGGLQHFDRATGTLEVCLTLANRGDKSIKIPIKLEVRDIKSAIGAASILNATNGLTSAGAMWDISGSVTGDQIPPRATSNPFCLSFHLEIPPKRVSLEAIDLLNLKMRVSASANGLSEAENESRTDPKKDK
jgi:hypothetical protein